jgi:YVTN family beta-propeller protein
MPISQLPRGTLIVDYRVEAVLGRGGMSVVYLAEDLRLKRHVALKLLTPTLAEDARFRERFLSESELAASLDHANVIPIYEAGEADGHLYIAMRYVEGSDLKARLGDGPLSNEEAVAVAAQVGGALDAAHERGLVHGDVKPSNVLIDGRGHVYLADFGLTKRLGDEESPAGDGQLMGTIDYVAPEQIRGEPVDGRADIYSLGCLLYECLTGRQPFKRGNDAAVLYAHLEDEPPATGTAADAVVVKALAKSPDDRYQTGAELTEAARDALGIEEERRGRWLPALVLVSLLGVAVAVAAIVTLRSGGAVAALHGELVRIDPSGNRVAGSVSVGAGPTGVAADSSSIWVTTLEDGNAWRVDPASLRASSVPTDGSPIGVATHGGSAFVVDTVSGLYGGGSGGIGLVSEISDQDGRAIHSIRTGTAVAIADGPAGLWVTREADVARLALVSPVVGTVGQKIPIRSNWNMTGLAVGAGGVWVLSDAPGRTLWRVDPERLEIRKTIHLPFVPAAVAASPDAVWVTAQLDDKVVRIDPRSGRIVAAVAVGREPLAVAVGAGAIWVANTIDRTVSRIDPSTNRVTATIDVRRSPTAIAVGDGSVWVATDAS